MVHPSHLYNQYYTSYMYTQTPTNAYDINHDIEIYPNQHIHHTYKQLNNIIQSYNKHTKYLNYQHMHYVFILNHTPVYAYTSTHNANAYYNQSQQSIYRQSHRSYAYNHITLIYTYKHTHNNIYIHNSHINI